MAKPNGGKRDKRKKRATMKISYDWLKQYVELSQDADTVAKILTAIGLEVESVERDAIVKGGMKGLIVGEVITCVKHPNADRLHLTTVNIGGDTPLRVVCGAPNVRAGLKVVVAPVGTKLYGNHGEEITIKRAKIRGEESEGMLCAEDEIGVGSSHEGIIELPHSARVGAPAATMFPSLCSSTFSIGITANRADALSHYGVARDLAAYLNQKVPTAAHLPEVSLAVGDESTTQLSLGDVDPRGCIRYAGLTIRGVKVGASPDWLANRLKSIGETPISNVVDITNFVMLEMGQPLHAFDLKAFPSRRVSVGFPDAATPIEVLGNQTKKLSGEDLAICDGCTPRCIAGVIGGAGSRVTDGTTDIFLESAVFDPVVIRKTSKRLGLQTEASYRFERGVDPAFTIVALRRAAALILEIAGGQIDGSIIDTYPRPLSHDPIIFDSQRAYTLMGITLSRRELETLFEGLEIDYRPIGAGKYELHVPYYRVDVTRMEDVAEDILRLYGYDRVPIADKMNVALDREARPATARHERMVRYMLVGAGFHEIMCNSLNSSRYYSKDLIYEGRHIVKILNPRSTDLDVLRPTLLLGGLDTIARNISRQRANLMLYEFGHCYTVTPQDLKPGEALRGYNEHARLGIWLCGNTSDGLWNEPRLPYDAFHLKGYCEAILREAGVALHDVRYRETSGGFLSSSATLYLAGEGMELCRFGEVDARLLELFDIKVPVFYAEMEWGVIAERWANKRVGYSDVAQYPEVRRDLALILDRGVTYASIEHIARRTAGNLLKRTELFDVYEGDKIPKGKKSYAVKFILQDAKATLDDITIDSCMQRLIDAFTKELGAELRN